MNIDDMSTDHTEICVSCSHYTTVSRMFRSYMEIL